MTSQGLEGVAAASPRSAFLSGPGKWLAPRPTWSHTCVFAGRDLGGLSLFHYIIGLSIIIGLSRFSKYTTSGSCHIQGCHKPFIFGMIPWL